MDFNEYIKSNVTEKMNKLYDYIGMEWNNEKMYQWNTMKTNKANSNRPSMSQSRILDNPKWWRNHMSILLYPRNESFQLKVTIL